MYLGGPNLPQDEIDRALDPLAFIGRRGGVGGPAPAALKQQLAQAHATLGEQKRVLAEATTGLRRVDVGLGTKEKNL